MKKTNVFIFASLLLATICGIFAQDMAYFLHENLIALSPIIYLTAITIISLLLFALSFVLAYLQYKKRQIEKNKIVSYLSVSGVVGGLTSCWSLFILAIWWG